MNKMLGDYQLREAAGSYWLIDMTQSGETWKRPLRLNETGARLAVGLSEGRTSQELAQELAEEYGRALQEMRSDVEEFRAQLLSCNIRLEPVLPAGHGSVRRMNDCL